LPPMNWSIGKSSHWQFRADTSSFAGQRVIKIRKELEEEERQMEAQKNIIE
jgi:hypothetical protein